MSARKETPKENEVARKSLDCCFAVHRALGPGLLESVYCAAIELELQRCGLSYEREAAIPVTYVSTTLGIGFRADFVVEECLILEIKSVESLAPIHKKKLLNYLTLTKFRLGLLVNFDTILLKDGIVRIANKLPE